MAAQLAKIRRRQRVHDDSRLVYPKLFSLSLSSAFQAPVTLFSFRRVPAVPAVPGVYLPYSSLLSSCISSILLIYYYYIIIIIILMIIVDSKGVRQG